MKRNIVVALSALAFAAPSHALVGIAVSAGLNSTTISGADQTMAGLTLPKAFDNDTGASLIAHRGKLSGMTQFGVKAWLELPLIPVEFEAASNIAWGYYSSSLILKPSTGTPDTIKVDVPAPIPGTSKKSGETPYFSMLTDLTLRYPILQLPPLSPIQPLKIWVGAGPTYVIASRVVDQSDLESVFGSAGSYDYSSQAQAQASARKTFTNDLLTNTWGAHLAVGAQFKIPVIPIALFVDGKWYLHVATSSAASKYPFVVNVGAGLSI